MSSSAIARMKTLMEKIMQIEIHKKKNVVATVRVSRKTANLFIAVEDQIRNVCEAFYSDGSSETISSCLHWVHNVFKLITVF